MDWQWLGQISGEGGPFIIGDLELYDALWRKEDADNQVGIEVGDTTWAHYGDRALLVWDAYGPGTAAVGVRDGGGEIAIVRLWDDDDAPNLDYRERDRGVVVFGDVAIIAFFEPTSDEIAEEAFAGEPFVASVRSRLAGAPCIQLRDDYFGTSVALRVPPGRYRVATFENYGTDERNVCYCRLTRVD